MMTVLRRLLFLFLMLRSVMAAGQFMPFRFDSLWFTVSTSDQSVILLSSKNGYVLRKSDGSFSGYNRLPGLGLHYNDQKFLFHRPDGIDMILVNDLGGLTLRMQGEKLVRIDRNQLTRMNITGRYFVHQDTIYTHGGYGFWSARNLVSFFNTATGTWDVVRPSPSGQIPPGICNHLIHHAGDDLFVYAGTTVNALDPTLLDLQENLWHYQMRTKTWSNEGPLHEALRFHQEGQLTFSYGRKQFVYPVRNLVAQIDFSTKKVTFYQPSNLLLNLARQRLWSNSHYGDAENLYLWIRLDEKAFLDFPHRSELVSVAVKDLMAGPGVTEDLIQYTIPLWWLLILPAAGLSFSLILRKRRQHRDKVEVTPNGFRLKDAHHPADEASLALVRLLLGASGPVENAEVLALVNVPTANFSHNTRVKNQLVDKTNIQLKTILGVDDDIILCTRLETDKRVRTYGIRREFFG